MVSLFHRSCCYNILLGRYCVIEVSRYLYITMLTLFIDYITQTYLADYTYMLQYNTVIIIIMKRKQ